MSAHEDQEFIGERLSQDSIPDQAMGAPGQSDPIERDVFGKMPRHPHRDWSHRRGEPRFFTLMWMIYLMAATALMFSSISRAQSVSPEVTRPAARTMLLVVVVGLSVLWPMVRFSQSVVGGGGGVVGGRGCVRRAVRDALVLFVPMQAVIWPQAWSSLAGWPMDVVAGVSALMLSWSLVLAGVIALGSASIERNKGDDRVRMLWMGVILLMVLAAPIIGGTKMMGTYVDVGHARAGWLLSPITGVLEIVRDRRALGTSGKVFLEHWKLIVAIGCVGIALLMIAKAYEVARARL